MQVLWEHIHKSLYQPGQGIFVPIERNSSAGKPHAAFGKGNKIAELQDKLAALEKQMAHYEQNKNKEEKKVEYPRKVFLVDNVQEFGVLPKEWARKPPKLRCSCKARVADHNHGGCLWCQNKCIRTITNPGVGGRKGINFVGAGTLLGVPSWFLLRPKIRTRRHNMQGVRLQERHDEEAPRTRVGPLHSALGGPVATTAPVRPFVRP